MSKEEILFKQGLDGMNIDFENQLITCMDEWAKQKSIEFGEWKDKYFKTTYPINRKMYTLKYYAHVGETGSTFGTHYNLPELYEIWKSKPHDRHHHHSRIIPA